MTNTPESAFSLVELMIVMLIVAILASMGVLSLRGSRDSANRGKVLAVAQSYDQAISSFAADHTGRVPRPGDAADWPVLAAGPLEPSTSAVAAARQSYLRTAPESVQDGLVAIQTASPVPGSSTPTGTVGVVVVILDPVLPSTRHRVEVWAAKNGTLPSLSCTMGTWVLPGASRC